MAYFLAIDIGNSRTKWGLFQDGELLESKSIVNNDVALNNQIFLGLDIQSIIVSSVNDKVLKDLAIEQFGVPITYLDTNTLLPYSLEYETIDTLGKDRMALVAAAKALFPNQNTLTIDAGTCITYDFLTSDSRYLGGAISPGVQLRLRAMNQFTDKLPLLNWNADTRPKSIGNSTITSMLSGVVNGLIGELNGFIDDYKEHYSSLQILLTGGDAKFFEKELKNGIFADPNLVLIGLHEILQYNRK